MLAGHIHAPKQIKLIDVPEPTLKDADGSEEEIIFQPELACLCGSDLPFFEGGYEEFAPQVGQSLHEMIGTVVETNGDRFRPGDKVLCVPTHHFGLYERFRVSARQAIPLDPRPPRDEALMAQPLGTVICALKKLPPVLDQDVAVVGQGPMGQLFCLALKHQGARRIIAIDPLEDRLEVSGKMGATDVIPLHQEDPVARVRHLTGGAMADVVVEVVGHREQALNLCVDLCRPHGRLLSFGVPTRVIDGIRWGDLFWKNLTVHTSVGPSFERDFPLAMQWIAERRVNVSPIITHRKSIHNIQDAFELFLAREDGVLKVLLDFD